MSVNDVITQINVQLPILIEEGSSTPLPAEIKLDGTFGGPTAGSLFTPARLLSGIGAALYSLSSDAVAAFGDDVLPQLATLDEMRTTITIGHFYDLTIVVVDSSELTYTFTPIGVAPPV